jgi:hypothetical protein
MGIPGKIRIIRHTDPEYLEVYRKHWGSGQTITGRQAARLARSDPQETQQEPDDSPSSRGRQTDDPLVNRESTED